jgi:hypothetical protein
LVELCGVVEPVEFPCIVTELFLGLVHTLCVNPDGVLEMVMIKTGIIVRKRRFFIGSALRFFFHPNTSPSSLEFLWRNERYQYPRASPGLRRRCLLFRPKGRGISPCFPCTRSGEEPSC